MLFGKIGTICMFLFLFILPSGYWISADAGTLVEQFTTTTYKDPAATTADWNTSAGELKLFPYSAGEVGARETPDNAVGLVIDGDIAYMADHNGGLTIMAIDDPETPLFQDIILRETFRVET